MTGKVGRFVYLTLRAVQDITLFLVAYVPLLMIFIALTWGQGIALTVTLVALLTWASGSVLVYLSKIKSSNVTSTRILSRAIGDDQSAMTYMATYILPFVAGVPNRAGEWIAFGIYIIVIFVLFRQGNSKLVNPTLWLLGYRVYRIYLQKSSADSNRENERYVVCRSKLEVGGRILIRGHLGSILQLATPAEETLR